MRDEGCPTGSPSTLALSEALTPYQEILDSAGKELAIAEGSGLNRYVIISLVQNCECLTLFSSGTNPHAHS